MSAGQTESSAAPKDDVDSKAKTGSCELSADRRDEEQKRCENRFSEFHEPPRKRCHADATAHTDVKAP